MKKVFSVLLTLCVAFSMLVIPASAENGEHTYADGNVPLDDSNIVYSGRWLKQDEVMAGYWQSTFTIRFTGTSLKIKGSSREMQIALDDQPVASFMPSPKEPVVSGLENKEHTATIMIANYSESSKFILRSITIDQGCKTLPVPQAPKIEFIGDSITAGWTDKPYKGSGTAFRFGTAYSYLTARKLGFFVNGCAIGSIHMCAGGGWNDMPTQYKKLTVSQDETEMWDASLYTPDYVCINLGTCDGEMKTSTMQTTYIEFIKYIQSIYPNVTVFAIVPFNASNRAAIMTVVNSFNSDKVVLVDTTLWQMKTKPTCDGTHPTLESQEYAAEKLAAFIKEYIYGPETTTPEATETATSVPSNEPTPLGAIDDKKDGVNMLIIIIALSVGVLVIAGAVTAVVIKKKKK